MGTASSSSSSPGFFDKIKSGAGEALMDNLKNKPVITGVALAAIGIFAILGMAHIPFVASVTSMSIENMGLYAVLGGAGIGMYILFGKLADKRRHGIGKTLFTVLKYLPLLVIGGIVIATLASNFCNLNEKLTPMQLIPAFLAGAAASVGIATLISHFVKNKKILKGLGIIGACAFPVVVGFTMMHYFQTNDPYTAVMLGGLLRPAISLLELSCKAINDKKQDRRNQERMAASRRINRGIELPNR